VKYIDRQKLTDPMIEQSIQIQITRRDCA